MNRPLPLPEGRKVDLAEALVRMAHRAGLIDLAQMGMALGELERIRAHNDRQRARWWR